MIWSIIYILIGCVVCKYYWHKYYQEEYKKAKKDGEVEEGMAQLILLYYIFFWPIAILYHVIKKILN